MALGEASVEVVPDLSNFQKELIRGIQRAFAALDGPIEKATGEIDRAFAEAGESVEQSFKEVDRAAERTGESIEDSFREAARQSEGAIGGIGGAFKRLGPMIAGTLAAAGIGALFKQAIDLSSDLNESINAVNVTFGDSAEEINKLGETAAQSLGLSRNEFNSLAVRFSAFAKTIAGPGGDVAGTLDDLTTRAADFASVMNLEVADAAQLFQSGLAGETEPLRKYGIDLSAASVQAYALSAGIIDSKRELTEQEKVMARYGLLMESTAQTQGDFANTSDSLANGMRILQASFQDALGGLGVALLPGLQALVGALNDLIPVIAPILNELGTVVAEAIGPLLDSIVPALEVVLGAVAPIIGDVVSAFAAFAPAFAPILEIVADLAVLFSGALSDALIAIAPAVVTIAEFFGDLFEAAQPLIEEALRILAPIIKQIAGLLSGALASVLPQIADAFGQVFAAIAPILPLLGEVFQSILDALAPVLPVLADALVSIALSLADLLVALMPVLEPLLQLVILIIDRGLAPAIELVAGAVALLASGLEKVIGLGTGIVNFFKTLARAAEDTLGGIRRAVGTVFDGLAGAFKGAINLVLGGIEAGLNFAIGVLNTALDGIDKAAGPWINFGSIPKVSIPRLANGAIVSSPTLATIGEAGPEAVIPISRPGRALDLLQQSGLLGLAARQGMVSSGAAVSIGTATFVQPVDVDLLAQKILVAERSRAWAA